MKFSLVSDYKPTGDQPQAIEQVVRHVGQPGGHTVLWGVTGSGKTFTMANVIQQIDRPTLVLSHNKTLAAQLYGEFKNFFPDNAVEYYVSYYDYYQPEAYLPHTDTYIEKDLSINDEIEKMRLSTIATLLSGRRDVVVVASVSCLYGCGNPEDFHATAIHLKVGDTMGYKQLLYKLVDALYTRTEMALEPATFRVRGDTVDIMAAFGEFGTRCFRVGFFDDEIESIETIDPVSGQRLQLLDQLTLYPATMFVTTRERINKAVGEICVDLGKQIEFFEQQGRTVEAQRIKQRVEYDVEMIKELGYCPGIENYSRYFDGRAAGTRPFCLLDYFPKDFFLIVDESHVTVPQVRAMFGGDAARKNNLVEYGFRLPAARDNRPLTFGEFVSLTGTTLYVSATPAEYELRRCGDRVVEQVIRPTGLLDPYLRFCPTENQIDVLVDAIERCVRREQKVIVCTTTKKDAENLSDYLTRVEVRNRYIHSDVDTLERVQIIEDLHADLFDVLIGVNLLREGLDLPEVALVAIIDADKEGFLRNLTSLMQTVGRAARHPDGQVLLFCNKVTPSIQQVVELTNRHRRVQVEYNTTHNMLPRQAVKSGDGQRQLLSAEGQAAQTPAASPVLAAQQSKGGILYPLAAEDHYAQVAESEAAYDAALSASKGNKSQIEARIAQLDEWIARSKEAMERASRSLDFIAAARRRDEMYDLVSQRDECRKMLSH